MLYWYYPTQFYKNFVFFFRGDLSSGISASGKNIPTVYLQGKHLEALEADLDIQLDYARKNIKIMAEDRLNKSYAYVTRNDLCKAFHNNTILTISNVDDEMDLQCTSVSYNKVLDT